MSILKGDLGGKIIRIRPNDVDREIIGYRALAIVGGEFAITPISYNVGITTLLGSCVAVMLCDPKVGLMSMNHFLLPGIDKGEGYKYGLHSLETMINEMMKNGAEKSRLVAKIAGGANVLTNQTNQIGTKNVAFARDFCAAERISIVSEHVYGSHGRVVLLAGNFETFVRQVANRAIEESIEKEESALSRRLSKSKQEVQSNITFF